MTFDNAQLPACEVSCLWRRNNKDTSKMLLSVSSFGESHRRRSPAVAFNLGESGMDHCLGYSYARTSRTVRREALRAGIKLAKALKKITTTSQSQRPGIEYA